MTFATVDLCDQHKGRAPNHVPLPSEKLGWGVAGGEVQFAGVTFTPGHYLYADGIVVSPMPLL